MSDSKAPRFLVVQLARFGDLLQSGRLLSGLCDQGEVHLVIDDSLVPLARLVYPGVYLHGIAAHRVGERRDMPQSVLQTLFSLSRVPFTRIFFLNFSGLSFALSTLFPAERVRGYSLTGGRPQVDFWPQQVMRWTHDRARQGINLMDIWAFFAPETCPPKKVTPLAQPSGGGLGVVLAGQNARRSLPAEILAPLVRAALARVGHGPIYFLGTQAEKRAARELFSLLPESVRKEIRDLTGRTDWAALIDTVQELDLLLSPDTGTMHLAARLGTPVMATFLSSAFGHETGPYGTGHLVLQALPPCAPCLETAPCPHGLLCRNFFASSALLRVVSGQDIQDLPGGLVLKSSFDALGVRFGVQNGHDPWEKERQAFRAWAGHMAGVYGLPAVAAWNWQDSWIQEQDWMLARPRRIS